MTDGPAMIGLLGKSSDSAEIKDLLRQLGAKAPKLKKGDTNAYVVAEKLGLELIFADEAYLTNRSDIAIGEGKLLLESVVFRGPEPPKAGYKGTLPHGADFGNAQADLQKVLGKPERSNPDLGQDRWTIDRHWVFARYTDDLKGIDNLSIQVLPTRNARERGGSESR